MSEDELIDGKVKPEEMFSDEQRAKMAAANTETISDNIDNSKNEKTPEELAALEKRCEEVAMEYVMDIKREPLPTRFAFSEFVASNLQEGFRDDYFIFSPYKQGFSYDLLDQIKNDALTSHSAWPIRQKFNRIDFNEPYGLFNKYYAKFREIYVDNKNDKFGMTLDQCKRFLYLEDVKSKYPEFYPYLAGKENQFADNLSLKEKDLGKLGHERRALGEAKGDYSIRKKIHEFEKKEEGVQKEINKLNNSFWIDFDSLTSSAEQYVESRRIDWQSYKPKLDTVFTNLAQDIDPKEWGFPEQQVWYDLCVYRYIEHINSRGNSLWSTQIYDCAVVIDPKKIQNMEKGSFVAGEARVNAGPESVLGVVDCSDLQHVLPEGFIANLSKSSFMQNPELSRPVYNAQGDLLWPRKMNREELKNYVKERDEQNELRKNTSNLSEVESVSPKINKIKSLRNKK